MGWWPGGYDTKEAAAGNHCSVDLAATRNFPDNVIMGVDGPVGRN